MGIAVKRGVDEGKGGVHMRVVVFAGGVRVNRVFLSTLESSFSDSWTEEKRSKKRRQAFEKHPT